VIRLAAAASPAALGFHAVQRRLGERISGAGSLDDGPASLEARSAATEKPRLAPATPVEGHAVRAARIDGDPLVAFGAFLDGTQQSRVLHYVDGLPIVHGTVAAVVRVRANRRLATWARAPRIERRLYAPCAFLPAAVCAELDELGLAVVDTSEADEHGERPAPHPTLLLDRAVQFVRTHREGAEQALAESWCAVEKAPLLVDGGLSGSDVVASSACTVGVVKSHRTLYADGDALRAVLTLKRGWRSTVFRIASPRPANASPRRSAVASWYLRLRDPAGRDPMWGLVRIEAADRGAAERPEELTARADLISRWVLAEVAPLALPDGRWDKMVYGVRDCEEFLRAVC
jgi:hypothetical protein